MTPSPLFPSSPCFYTLNPLLPLLEDLEGSITEESSFGFEKTAVPGDDREIQELIQQIDTYQKDPSSAPPLPLDLTSFSLKTPNLRTLVHSSVSSILAKSQIWNHHSLSDLYSSFMPALMATNVDGFAKDLFLTSFSHMHELNQTLFRECVFTKEQFFDCVFDAFIMHYPTERALSDNKERLKLQIKDLMKDLPEHISFIGMKPDEFINPYIDLIVEECSLGYFAKEAVPIYLSSLLRNLWAKNSWDIIRSVEERILSQPINQPFFIPILFSTYGFKHFIIASFTRMPDGTFNLKIINTGSGTKYHLNAVRDGKTYITPYIEFQGIPEDRMIEKDVFGRSYLVGHLIDFVCPSHNFYLNTHKIGTGEDYLYKKLFITLAPYFVRTELSKDSLIRSQKAGTCVYSTTKACMRFFTDKPATYERVLATIKKKLLIETLKEFSPIIIHKKIKEFESDARLLLFITRKIIDSVSKDVESLGTTSEEHLSLLKTAMALKAFLNKALIQNKPRLIHLVPANSSIFFDNVMAFTPSKKGGDSESSLDRELTSASTKLAPFIPNLYSLSEFKIATSNPAETIESLRALKALIAAGSNSETGLNFFSLEKLIVNLPEIDSGFYDPFIGNREFCEILFLLQVAIYLKTAQSNRLNFGISLHTRLLTIYHYLAVKEHPDLLIDLPVRILNFDKDLYFKDFLFSSTEEKNILMRAMDYFSRHNLSTTINSSIRGTGTWLLEDHFSGQILMDSDGSSVIKPHSMLTLLKRLYTKDPTLWPTSDLKELHKLTLGLGAPFTEKLEALFDKYLILQAFFFSHYAMHNQPHFNRLGFPRMPQPSDFSCSFDLTEGKITYRTQRTPRRSPTFVGVSSDFIEIETKLKTALCESRFTFDDEVIDLEEPTHECYLYLKMALEKKIADLGLAGLHLAHELVTFYNKKDADFISLLSMLERNPSFLNLNSCIYSLLLQLFKGSTKHDPFSELLARSIKKEKDANSFVISDKIFQFLSTHIQDPKIKSNLTAFFFLIELGAEIYPHLSQERHDLPHLIKHFGSIISEMNLHKEALAPIFAMMNSHLALSDTDASYFLEVYVKLLSEAHKLGDSKFPQIEKFKAVAHFLTFLDRYHHLLDSKEVLTKLAIIIQPHLPDSFRSSISHEIEYDKDNNLLIFDSSKNPTLCLELRSFTFVIKNHEGFFYLKEKFSYRYMHLSSFIKKIEEVFKTSISLNTLEGLDYIQTPIGRIYLEEGALAFPPEQDPNPKMLKWKIGTEQKSLTGDNFRSIPWNYLESHFILSARPSPSSKTTYYLVLDHELKQRALITENATSISCFDMVLRRPMTLIPDKHPFSHFAHQSQIHCQIEKKPDRSLEESIFSLAEFDAKIDFYHHNQIQLSLKKEKELFVLCDDTDYYLIESDHSFIPFTSSTLAFANKKNNQKLKIFVQGKLFETGDLFSTQLKKDAIKENEKSLGILSYTLEGKILKAQNLKSQVYLTYLHAMSTNEHEFLESLKLIYPHLYYPETIDPQESNFLIELQKAILEKFVSYVAFEGPVHLLSHLSLLLYCVENNPGSIYESRTESAISSYLNYDTLQPIPIELAKKISKKLKSQSSKPKNLADFESKYSKAGFMKLEFLPQDESQVICREIKAQWLESKYEYSKSAMILNKASPASISFLSFKSKGNSLLEILENLHANPHEIPHVRQFCLDTLSGNTGFQYDIAYTHTIILLAFTLNPALIEEVAPLVLTKPFDLEKFIEKLVSLVPQMNAILSPFSSQPSTEQGQKLMLAKEEKLIYGAVFKRSLPLPSMLSVYRPLSKMTTFDAPTLTYPIAVIDPKSGLYSHADLFCLDTGKKAKLQALKIQHAIFTISQRFIPLLPLKTPALLQLSIFARQIETLDELSERELMSWITSPLSISSVSSGFSMAEILRLNSRHQTLGFDDLVARLLDQDSLFYVTQDLSTDFSHPTIPHLANYANHIKKKLTFCLLVKSLNSRLKKALALCTESYLRLEDLKELSHLLLNPKPIADAYLPQLIFEYKSNLHLTAKQTETLDFFLSEKVAPTLPSYRIAQVNMGGGKTSVIAPILAATFCREKRIPLFLVHPSQKQTLLKDLKVNQYLFFKQTTIDVALDRSEMTEENLKRLVDCFDGSESHRQIIVSTPETIQGIELEYLHTLFTSSDDPRLKLLEVILKKMKENCDVIIDEYASSCDVCHLVNFPLTDPRYLFKHLSEEKIELVKELFLIMTSPEIDAILKLTSNHQRHIEPLAYKQFLDLFAAKVAEHYRGLFTQLPLTNEELQKFITVPTETAKLLAKITHLKKTEAAQTLCLIQYLCIELLPSLFKKNEGREFGRTNHLETAGKIVPYKGVASPTDTEFGFHYETLCYHFMTAISSSISKDQIRAFGRQLFEKALSKSTKMSISIDSTKEAILFKTLCGINLIECGIEAKIEEAYQRLLIEKRTKRFDHIFEIESYFAKQYVGYFPYFLSSNPHNLMSLFSNVCGFTGTPWNLSTYGIDSQKEVLLDPQAELAIEENFISKKSLSSSLVVKIPEFTPQGLLSTLKTQMEAKAFCNVNAIIDVSGLFREYNNFDLARMLIDALAQLHPEKKELVVIYFDQAEGQTFADSPHALVRNATSTKVKKVPLKSLTKQALLEQKLKPGDYFVYYDERHTQGIDIQLAEDAIGVVTIDEKTPYHQFSQGVMRLRKFDLGQNVVLVSTPPVISKLPEAFSSKSSLLAFLKNNQKTALVRLNFRSYKQQIRNLVRQVVIKQITEQSVSLASKEKAKKFVFEEITDDTFSLALGCTKKIPLKEALLNYAMELYSDFVDAGFSGKESLYSAIASILEHAEENPLLDSDNPTSVGDDSLSQQITVQQHVHAHTNVAQEIDQSLVTEANRLSPQSYGTLIDEANPLRADAIAQFYMTNEADLESTGLSSISTLCGLQEKFPSKIKEGTYMEAFSNLRLSSFGLFIFENRIEHPFSMFRKKIESVLVVINQSGSTPKPIFIGLTSFETTLYIKEMRDDKPLEFAILCDLHMNALVDNPHEIAIRSQITNKQGLIEALAYNEDFHLLKDHPEETLAWLKEPVLGAARQRFLQLKTQLCPHLKGKLSYVDELSTSTFIETKALLKQQVEQRLSDCKTALIAQTTAAKKEETKRRIICYIVDLSWNEMQFVSQEFMPLLPKRKVSCIMDAERLHGLVKSIHLKAANPAQVPHITVE